MWTKGVVHRVVELALVLCAIYPRCTETAYVRGPMLDELDMTIINERKGKNTVVSSFAFRLPFCKLAAVASALTRHEIISILDITSLSQTKTCYTSLFPDFSPLLETDLIMLNKIYVNYTDNINENFILDAQTYGITVSMIGYGYIRDAVDYVNREFSSKTYMRIQDVLDVNDIDGNSSILAVNGFHYKGTWESPFMQNPLQKIQFTSGSKTLSLEMIQAHKQCMYWDDNAGHFKAITLRLSQPGMYITFILPYSNSSIIKLLNTMTRNPQLTEMVNKRMQWKFVKISLPKFKVKSNVDWTPYLKRIGLNLTTHKDNTGLNGILKDEEAGPNMYLSKAKQKLFIEIGEGPSAYRAVGLAAEMPRVRPGLELPVSPAVSEEEFTVDGPFFFTVVLTVPQTTGKLGNRTFNLFKGVYYGPE